MYLGRIVEIGPAERVARAPRHPYTRVLWSSLVEKRSREAAPGASDAAWSVFDFERPATGCPFAPRCPVYAARGRPRECTDPASAPRLTPVGEGHAVACHFPL
jgi:peptide/nickel transport system ATP-binding protein